MNLNKVFILGNLTRDPELRQTPSGQAVCTIGIATNRFFTDNGGQKQQAVEYHTVVAWGRNAEIINQYVRRGNLILVEGRLQTRSWQDQQGAKHYRTEVIAERIQLGPRGGSASSGGGDWQRNERASGAGQSSPAVQEQKTPPEPTPIIDIGDDDEEIDVKDIPF
jgi:single-strand DNA-binding protein